MVIFENILNNLQTMGPIFWAGAAAIALGATLLIASVFTLFKRIKLSPTKFRNPLLKTRTSASSKPKIVGNVETVRKTASGYEPAVFPYKNEEIVPPVFQNAVPMDLTNRLHQAADTLEEMIQGLKSENHSNGFSALKEDHEGVEYLFKTTTG